jgi:hypothetical protein
MEKLSLYELLSFVVPGFVLLELSKWFGSFFIDVNIKLDESLSNSLLQFVIALFLGIIIHVLTFKIFLNIKWYKKMIYKSLQKISVENEFIQRAIPYLNEHYISNRKHNEKPVNENEAENNLFDYAYCYLEINDKIAAAKSFQSLYFLFRNIFTINLIYLPISVFTILILYTQNYCCCKQRTALTALILLIIIAFVLVFIGRWLREKTVEKVIWSYYVAITHGENNNNKK